MIVLPPRLQAIADLIPTGARVVDVGTDHARLPAYLAQRGLSARLLATDLRPGPLARARRTLARCGLEDAVTLCLADGLRGLPLAEYDTVVLAGLGADTIVDICRLTALPGHLSLLMQPMSHTERLRAFLGRAVAAEELVREGRRLYNILTVRASDIPAAPVSPGEWYVSRALAQSGHSLLPEYLAQQIARLTAETEGLAASARPADALRRAQTTQALQQLLTLRSL
ncbi:MAG: class I SAM-dependent methyltransferase [Oscillospiraceae bacterium]|jgi:tRNA (adenine22-N1)-methyltransferase|nr:class I SAM-dependent methyltransferase [Oscillospiraceae bacterium]